jgi:hypothetical protein
MIKYYKQYFIVLVSMLLISCATVATLDTYKKQLSALDLQTQAVITSAHDLTVAGVLQKDEVNSLVQNLDTSMTLAWAAYGKGDLLETDNKMQLVNSLLLEIREIIVSKEGTQ